MAKMTSTTFRSKLRVRGTVARDSATNLGGMRITSGKGWTLSSDAKPEPPKKINPESPKPKIRLEKRAGGKYVTCISGLHTYGRVKLDSIAAQLKTSFGTGGTVKNGTIEMQGDKVKLIESWFRKIS